MTLGMPSESPESSERPRILIGDRTVTAGDGETILEALERAGLDVPHGCRAGSCCKCLLQAEGAAPPSGQGALRPTLKAEGFFLACQARPEADLRIRDVAPPAPLWATVARSERVADGIARILLRPENPLHFRPGQYVDVLHPSGAARSYSIASLPDDPLLELHVSRHPRGLVSPWLQDRPEGDRLRIRGAFGQCFYLADDRDKRLFLVGAGTGLAPLLGIVRAAVESGHRGAIDLVHGALEPKRLYLRDEVAALADATPTLRVHHCVLRNGTGREREGALDQVALDVAGPLAETRAYLCGDPSLVGTLRRELFLAGIPSSEILADLFLPQPPGRKQGAGATVD